MAVGLTASHRQVGGKDMRGYIIGAAVAATLAGLIFGYADKSVSLSESFRVHALADVYRRARYLFVPLRKRL